MKNTPVSDVTTIEFGSTNIRHVIRPLLKKMGLLAPGLALAITTSASAAYFSDDFSSGNLNNWAPVGTWDVATTGTQKYAHGVYADENGSLTHAFAGSVASSWAVSFKYDFEWGADINGGDPRLTLGVDMLDNSDNGYRVFVREGSWGDPSTYPSLQIYSVIGGTASSTPLASGQGFSIGGWRSIEATSPEWKSVTFTWDSLTGGLTANTNSPYGTPCSVTNASYTTFTKIRIVGKTFGEGIDVDNISVSVVPEPTALALLGCGLLVLYRRKK